MENESFSNRSLKGTTIGGMSHTRSAHYFSLPIIFTIFFLFLEQHQILLRESLWNTDKTTEFQFFFSPANPFAIFGDVSLAVPNLAIINKLAKWMESVTDNRDNFKLRELHYS